MKTTLRNRLALFFLISAPCVWGYSVMHTARHNSPAALYGMAGGMLLALLSFIVCPKK